MLKNFLYLTRKNAIHSSLYSFGRKIKDSPSLRARQIDKEDSREVPMDHEHKQEERTAPDSDAIDEEFMAKCRLNIQHLPERLLKRAHQVFTKYKSKDVREYAKEYQKMYHMLNGMEKPTDFNKTKPFANTDDSDLNKNNKNEFIYLHSKKMDTDSIERKIDELREKKNEAKIIQPDSQESFDKIKSEKSNNEELALPSVIYTQNLALAYLLKKMPHTFGIGCRILSEVKYRLPKLNPKNFLDFGAGLGSGSWAFFDLFPEGQNIVACEPSRIMRRLGKHLTQDIDKIIWIDSLSKTVNYTYAYSFDIVYCAFVLEEIRNPESRMLVLETLWQKVGKNGVFIIVETGTPKGFRFIHDVRRWILTKNRSEATILAPCPHHEKCPLSNRNSWCHFDQPIAAYPKEVFPKLPKEDTIFYEKFSFLVVKKGEVISKGDSPSDKSHAWDRIVRPIMKKSKHKIVDLCTTDGELERVIVAKSHEGGEYKASKTAKWGDLWRFPRRIPNKFRREGGRGSKRLW